MWGWDGLKLRLYRPRTHALSGSGSNLIEETEKTAIAEGSSLASSVGCSRLEVVGLRLRVVLMPYTPYSGVFQVKVEKRVSRLVPVMLKRRLSKRTIHFLTSPSAAFLMLHATCPSYISALIGLRRFRGVPIT